MNNINMKKCAWRNWSFFLEAIFSDSKKRFSKFPPNIFIILRDINGVRKLPFTFQPIIIQKYYV